MRTPSQFAAILRFHVLGPIACPTCGNTRDNWVFDKCTQEGQCDWNMNYGTHTNSFDYPYNAKHDMLDVANFLDTLKENDQ